ncbi:hypothetical protein PMAYCL1PPCAC_26318 [Pristionchus mayeri]|uniref:Uncharacterized protein n=1 Tax=Pristionchus mayeri TaxID=1317129 RepID=A0AAN5D3Y7_9BILA|nr:hypothetical protein PMAYCL1PPCAC_26318 [Pristionchus mayeri]
MDGTDKAGAMAKVTTMHDTSYIVQKCNLPSWEVQDTPGRPESCSDDDDGEEEPHLQLPSAKEDTQEQLTQLLGKTLSPAEVSSLYVSLTTALSAKSSEVVTSVVNRFFLDKGFVTCGESLQCWR